MRLAAPLIAWSELQKDFFLFDEKGTVNTILF